KALRPQELVGHILRRDADASNLRQPNGCRFRGCLLSKRSAPAHEARRADRRERGEKATSSLHLRHGSFPSEFSELSRCWLLSSPNQGQRSLARQETAAMRDFDLTVQGSG